MHFTVQLFLNEEVAPLLQVEAAVITHETFWMVELVTGFHYCATVAGKKIRLECKHFKRLLFISGFISGLPFMGPIEGTV